jgi:TonB family protein
MLAPISYSSTLDSHRAYEQAGASGLVIWASPQSDGDEPSVTPLMRAVRDGESKAFKSLLKQRPDLNAKDSLGWTALYYAATRNDFNMVKALVERGADIAAGDNQGITALMAAAQKGGVKIVKYLIEKGADVNARTKNGLTVLDLVKPFGKAEVIEIIKAAGAVEGEPTLPLVKLGEQKTYTRPTLLNNPTPSYTEEARRNRVTGVVNIRVLVGADGAVKRVRVISGLPDGLTRQALIAAYNMRFKPATKDGQPVAMWIATQVEFNLK